MKKTLNVGCGERVFEEYPPGYLCTNMDERDLDGVDIIGDVSDLSRFSDREFSYLLASDVLEHFPISQTVELLEEWGRVLAKGGTLELRVPNFDFIVQHYNEHHDISHVSWLIMGGQEYSGNFHKVVFNKEWLKHLCEQAGFTFDSCVEESSNLVMKAINS